MQTYFPPKKIVCELAKKMKKQLKVHDVNISLSKSYDLVAQCFGHENYQDLIKFDGFADYLPNDRKVSHEVRVRRFSQYAAALIDGGLEPGVVYEVLENVNNAGFWGLKNGLAIDLPERSETVQANVLDEDLISPFRLTPRHPDIIESIVRQLRAHSRRLRTNVTARKQVVARMFGYATYSELHAACGRDSPSHCDWHVSPEELDRRALGYVGVLVQCGVNARDAAHILSSVGCKGWWAIELNPAFSGGARQSQFADRIQGREGASRWRRNSRAPLQAMPAAG